MSALEQRVLVLNKAWLPVDVVSAMEAVCKVFSERALFIDPATYQTFTWEDWVDNWGDAIKHAKVEAGKVISAPSLSLLAPEIILHRTHKSGNREKARPKFSRRNVYVRDGYKCQYCGRKFDSTELNIDHVKPTSRGGKTTWTNTVLSCIPCNDRKANRTPEEAGMRLLRQPQVPSSEEVRRGYLQRVMSRISFKPPSWEALLGDMYWNVQLKEE